MWNYKGYSIIQRNGRDAAGFWLSSAKFRTRHGELNLTAYSPKLEGYADERNAQQATEQFVRDHIDIYAQRIGE